jgi:hypothetical protein
MFTDDQASMSARDRADKWNDEHPDAPAPKTTKDVEYEEIEGVFRETFPDEELVFSRDKTAFELRNGGPDYYVFDIGGLDGFTGTGGRCKRFADELVAQIEDHPGTTFVPWSAFTQRYVEGALCDLLGDDCWAEKKIPPNVVVLDDKEMTGWVEQTILEKLGAAYRARKTRSSTTGSRSSSTPGTSS